MSRWRFNGEQPQDDWSISDWVTIESVGESKDTTPASSLNWHEEAYRISESAYGTSPEAEPVYNTYPALAHSVQSSLATTVDSYRSLQDGTIRSARLRSRSFYNESSGADGPSQSQGVTLQCTIPGCSVKHNFNRKWDLNRHIATKHALAKEYQCPATGCFKKRSRTAFARSDKLVSHIRSAHNAESTYMCHVPSCKTTPLTGDLMSVHLKEHLSQFPTDQYKLRHVYHALTPPYRECMVATCRKKCKIDELLNHLKTHSVRALEIAYSTFETYGVGISTGLTTTDVNVTCPLCGLRKTNFTEFRAHLACEHILNDTTHFETWFNYVTLSLTNTAPRRASSLDWSFIWTPWKATSEAVDSKMQLKCPFCGIIEAIQPDAAIKHHLCLLCDAQKLVHARRHILQYWPEFASHPVFDDVRNPAITGKGSTSSMPVPFKVRALAEATSTQVASCPSIMSALPEDLGSRVLGTQEDNINFGFDSLSPICLQYRNVDTCERHIVSGTQNPGLSHSRYPQHMSTSMSSNTCRSLTLAPDATVDHMHFQLDRHQSSSNETTDPFELEPRGSSIGLYDAFSRTQLERLNLADTSVFEGRRSDNIRRPHATEVDIPIYEVKMRALMQAATEPGRADAMRDLNELIINIITGNLRNGTSLRDPIADHLIVADPVTGHRNELCTCGNKLTQSGIVSMLAHTDADVDVLDPTYAFSDHLDVSQSLNVSGNTTAASIAAGASLHAASPRHYQDIERLLMDLGTILNAVNNAACTPLHFATSSGQRNVLQSVLDVEADSFIESVCDPIATEFATSESLSSSFRQLLNVIRRSFNVPYLVRGSSEAVDTAGDPPDGDARHTCGHPGCFKAFTRPRDLHLHERTHLDPEQRPHACERCGKRFQFPKDLKRHTKSHEGPQFFCTIRSCTYSTSGFKRRDHLHRHLRHIHSVDINE